MASPYDDIQNALVLIQDGEEHTVTLTNVGGSQETNEGTYIGTPGSTWMTFDVADYLEGFFNFSDPSGLDGCNVHIYITDVSTDTGASDPSFLPEIDTLKVADVAWYRTSPDFSLLDYEGVGDPMHRLRRGRHPHPARSDHRGIRRGAGRIAGSSLANMSKTGQVVPAHVGLELREHRHHHLHVSDRRRPDHHRRDGRSGAGVTVSGDHLEKTAPRTPSTTSQALIGRRSSITRVTTYVRDDNLPPAGRYRVFAEMRQDGSDDSYCTIRRNGLPYALVTTQGFTGFTSRNLDPTTWTWVELTDQVQRQRPSERYGPEYCPVLSGDEYQFSIWNDGNDIVQIRRTAWFLVEEGGSAGPPIQLLEMPELPEGATTAVDIPDFTRWTASHSGSGTMLSGKDICVTDNGDIYILFDEADGTDLHVAAATGDDSAPGQMERWFIHGDHGRPVRRWRVDQVPLLGW